MPAALNLASEHGDDLAVLFVQAQGLSADESEAFALGRKWLGTPAMRTAERPFATGSRGLPNFALVSSDGMILLKGQPLGHEKGARGGDQGRDHPRHCQTGSGGLTCPVREIW